MMMRADRHDEGTHEGERTETNTQSEAMIRSLEQHGVDVTGSESSAELAMMQGAVDGFRRATEMLEGQVPNTGRASELCRQVVPPRAADETPRQYAERLNRMSDRFRALAQGSSRDRSL
jgi:hypothetical protein